jgi:hypothetical protein
MQYPWHLEEKCLRVVDRDGIPQRLLEGTGIFVIKVEGGLWIGKR